MLITMQSSTCVIGSNRFILLCILFNMLCMYNKLTLNDTTGMTETQILLLFCMMKYLHTLNDLDISLSYLMSKLYNIS